MSPRIYLDNAATSFPKPEAVYTAMDHYHRQLGAAVGRGAYSEGVEVSRTINRCRKLAAELLGAESPERIVFTFNGTDSLNLALHGFLQPGDHVVTSLLEHNSVLRPLRELARRQQVETTYVTPNAAGRIEPADFQAAIRPSTKLFVLTHASNVTGMLQPIAEVGEIARQRQIVFLVDAAQSAGHLPIDLQQLPVDLLACPGHKGLLGPLGTGLLYIRPGLEERIASQRQGGTGTRSEDDTQPANMPDKYESGNHNAPGLVGLAAALEYLQTRTISHIRQHELQLISHFFAELFDQPAAPCPPNLHLYGTRVPQERVGVFSLTIDGSDPQTLSTILDQSFQIATRPGLHCAPGTHRTLGTLAQGGTLRFSVGPFTTPEELTTAAAALKELAAAL